jgi:hypothetical protein
MQKIRETRKLESVHEEHFVEWKIKVDNQAKSRVSEDSSFYAQKP